MTRPRSGPLPRIAPDDQGRLAEALDYAVSLHGHQTRKGGDIPYVSHLLVVAGLVIEYGGNRDQAIAALLHDALEDQGHEHAPEIERRFGAEVLRLVLGCTDTAEGEDPAAKRPWRERKERYVEHVRREADDRTLLVSACDKLHNLYALVTDVREEGLRTLERFRPSPKEMVWYHRELLEAMGPRVPARLRSSLGDLVDELERLIVAEPASAR